MQLKVWIGLKDLDEIFTSCEYVLLLLIRKTAKQSPCKASG